MDSEFQLSMWMLGAVALVILSFEAREMVRRWRARRYVEMVRERLEELGGTMQVVSRPGKGTTVTLRAPLGMPPG